MPGIDQEPNLATSILDRLLDDKPGEVQDPFCMIRQGVRELKKSVARDLEELFNTRQGALKELAVELAEVRSSLLTYGLPDLTSMNPLNPHDRNRIQRLLETAISAFEPRLTSVCVTVDPSLQEERGLRFHVEAKLRTEPVLEPVAFDTVLRLLNQQCVVKDRA